MGSVVALYEALASAQDERARARVIAEAFEQIDFRLDYIPGTRNASAMLLTQFFKSAFYHQQVVQDKVGIHGLNVADRVNFLSQVGYAGVFKLADYM